MCRVLSLALLYQPGEIMNGFKSRASTIIEISRGSESVALEMTAPPVGYLSWLRSCYPAPQEFINGIAKPDPAAEHEYHSLLLYCRLAAALRPSGAIDTPEPAGTSRHAWNNYALGVRDEFRGANLSDGDVLILTRALNKLEESSTANLEASGNS